MQEQNEQGSQLNIDENSKKTAPSATSDQIADIAILSGVPGLKTNRVQQHATPFTTISASSITCGG